MGERLGVIYLLPWFLQSCCGDLVMALLAAFLRNITLGVISMKAWQASFLKSREQANLCKNSGETEEVVQFK